MTLWRSLRSHVKPLVYRLRNRHLYRLANFYVNAVDNDHDCEFSTNGEERFAHDRLPGCKLAFDLGAAKGNWTDIALAANPQLEVHCFEPTSRRMAILEAKFGTRVVLNKLAMGDKPGESQIFYGASGGSNSLFPQRFDGESYAPGDVETIKVTTVDDYCRDKRIEHVDFIKMDIEGFEPAAIRGSEQMLKEGKIAIVQFEYSYVFLDAGESLMRLMKYVATVNPVYRFYKLLPDGVREVPRYDHTLDNFKTQNWAIIKTDT